MEDTVLLKVINLSEDKSEEYISDGKKSFD